MWSRNSLVVRLRYILTGKKQNILSGTIVYNKFVNVNPQLALNNNPDFSRGLTKLCHAHAKNIPSAPKRMNKLIVSNYSRSVRPHFRHNICPAERRNDAVFPDISYPFRIPLTRGPLRTDREGDLKTVPSDN